MTPSAPRGIDELVGELDAWTARSRRPVSLHRYGADSDQVAELRLPDGAGPHPIALILHGGFWGARFTRALTAPIACDLADRGWASFNAEYRRTGTGGGPVETLDDVRAAIGALAGLDASLDLARVVVIGHSAGGQLGLCCATTAPVRAVVSLGGVCDLVAAARDGLGDGAALAFTGATPDERPDLYALADPLAQLPTGARTLLIHGDADQRVPVDQSRRYAAAARAAGDRCELLELAGTDHFAPILPWSAAWAEIAARIDRLL